MKFWSVPTAVGGALSLSARTTAIRCSCYASGFIRDELSVALAWIDRLGLDRNAFDPRPRAWPEWSTALQLWNDGRPVGHRVVRPHGLDSDGTLAEYLAVRGHATSHR